MNNKSVPYNVLCSVIAILVIGGVALFLDGRHISHAISAHHAELEKYARTQEMYWSQKAYADSVVIPIAVGALPEYSVAGRPIYWKERTYCDLLPGGIVRVAPFDTNEDLRLYEYSAPAKEGGCPDGIFIRLDNDTIGR